MTDPASWLDLLAFGPQGWGDELLLGAWLTIQLAVVSLAGGLLFGLLLTAAAVSRFAPARWCSAAYMIFMRGVPEFLVAAVAVGMSPWQALHRIRLPQMWRFAIPGLANLWMVMLKDTSLAAVIAINELLRVAKVAGETSRTPLLFFVAAGVIYLLLTGLSDLARHRLEARARRGIA